MELHQIVIRPIINEKTTRLTEKTGQKQYAFVVNINANKIQIKNALERQFDCQIDTIRTIIVRSKNKRRVTKTRIIEGKTARYKKAYISLIDGKELNLYGTS